MNEFEWRRQLRDLQQPGVPRRDLWPAIDAALDRVAIRPPARAPRRHMLAWLAAAASLLLVAGAGWHSWFAATPPAGSATASHANWKPADPRLAGAAIELDAARLELKLAIEQAPDSAALQRLLRHTERQQAHLRQLAGRAS